MDEARERVVARAAGRGEGWLVTTNAMVRKEMSRKTVEYMQAKASRSDEGTVALKNQLAGLTDCCGRSRFLLGGTSFSFFM